MASTRGTHHSSKKEKHSDQELEHYSQKNNPEPSFNVAPECIDWLEALR